MRKEMEAKVLAFLGERSLEATRSYVAKGRRFKALDDRTLRDSWMSAFKRYASDPSNRASRKLWEALQAEMAIRRIEPPMDRVQDEVNALAKRAVEVVQRLRTDPDRWVEVNEDLQSAIDAVTSERERSAKN